LGLVDGTRIGLEELGNTARNGHCASLLLEKRCTGSSIIEFGDVQYTIEADQIPFVSIPKLAFGTATTS